MARLPPGDGPPNARVFIVGEAYGEEEARVDHPFVGRSGEELNKMLGEAGLSRSQCYVTNVVNARPPGNNIEAWVPEKKKDITHDMVMVQGRYVKPIVKEGYESLLKEIALVRPRVIIALGNTALWALCGHVGIVKWRGSILSPQGVEAPDCRVIPTYHPAAVLRMWEWRPIAIHDLARAAREVAEPTPPPAWRFQIRPTLFQVLGVLDRLWNQALLFDEEVWLDLDLETTGGHIRCAALSWSHLDALCIPFMAEGYPYGYWKPEEEGWIVWMLYRLLTSPRVRVRGQNLLFDYQYIHRHWHFIPNLGQDTMLTHHVLWAGMPKALGFQASMYCEYYSNWKGMVKHNEEKEGA